MSGNEPRDERFVFGDGEVDHDTLLANIALLPFLDGTQPFARGVDLDFNGEIETLAPKASTVERRYDSKSITTLLLTGTGWTLLLEQRAWSDSTFASITGTTKAVVDTLTTELRTLAPPREKDATTVPMRMWHWAGSHAASDKKSVGAPSWSEIAANYPGEVASDLERLMNLRALSASGRLILWHGAPGTGKTTAIRALAREWASWVDVEYVLDPERLFENTGYLMAALTDTDEHAAERVRLVIVEDADQFIKPTAGQDGTPGGLSRLLNLTDGIVGQGIRSMVLITTNEPLQRLHPAVTRPGRCLANIDFRRFSQREAATWLGTHNGPPGGAVLADLLALKGDLAGIGTGDSTPEPGQYL